MFMNYSDCYQRSFLGNVNKEIKKHIYIYIYIYIVFVYSTTCQFHDIEFDQYYILVCFTDK